MRVLVCGGRNYSDEEFVYLVLGALHARHIIDTIIAGGANGADRYAMEWAIAPCQVKTFFPEWIKYGKSAGPKRNQRMIDEGKPDLVVAFPGGRGTADMIKRAKRARVPVHIYTREKL